MSNIYGKGAKGRATKLHAELVRARGRCERCGSTDNLQCAHIMTRTFSHTRCDLNAAWCLCARCHQLVDSDSWEKVCFATKTHGADGYEAVRRKAYDGVKVKIDWEEVLAELKALAFVAGLS